MKTPTVFGGYHFLCLGITVGLTVLLCRRCCKCRRSTVRKVVFAVAVLVTVLEAFWVFLSCLGIAVALNEVFWYLNVTGGEVCNLFFVNPHFPGTLAVYKEVQQVVPYPWCLLVYIAVFTVAAYLMLLAAWLIRRWNCRKLTARVPE